MKLNKKGLTLIEIVVVLVIIAILAAILVPSLLRWVDKAKDSNVLAAAKTVQKTVASEISKLYEDDVEIGTTHNDFGEEFWEKVSDSVGKTITNDPTKDRCVTFKADKNVIVEFTYTEGKKTAQMKEDGTWVIINKD
ncbi:MAG: prepilin-type N-terminal cleavage/methylation domain-containing protein [Ruminococcaceae bacterium]|nr:prepilin-type N-terminal cleavage/methylation domain-containing protein [Oscillospiraceae bacterium]